MSRLLSAARDAATRVVRVARVPSTLAVDVPRKLALVAATLGVALAVKIGLDLFFFARPLQYALWWDSLLALFFLVDPRVACVAFVATGTILRRLPGAKIAPALHSGGFEIGFLVLVVAALGSFAWKNRSGSDRLRLTLSRGEILAACLLAIVTVSCALQTVGPELARLEIPWTAFLVRIPLAGAVSGRSPLAAAGTVYLLFKAMALYVLCVRAAGPPGKRARRPPVAWLTLLRVSAIVIGVLSIGDFVLNDSSTMFRGERRASFPFFNPNILALWTVIILPFLLAEDDAGPRRTGPLRIASLLITAAALFATGTRGAWVAVAVAILLFRRAPYRRLLAWACVAAIVAKVGTFVTRVPVRPPSAESVAAFDHHLAAFNAAAGGRPGLWATAVNAFLAHPIAGLGFGSFYLHGNEYIPADFPPSIFHHEHAHNVVMEAAADLGAIGLVVVLAGVYVIGSDGVREARNDAPAFMVGRASACAALAILGYLMFDFPIFYAQTALWLPVVAAARRDDASHVGASPRRLASVRRRFHIALVFLVASTVLAMSAAWWTKQRDSDKAPAFAAEDARIQQLFSAPFGLAAH